jgi:tetratricopeptide (TPR) repeat protein
VEHGLQALEQERWRQASEAFTEALELEPDNYRARLGLAHSELQLGDWPAALVSFQRGLSLAPAAERANAVTSFLGAIIDYAKRLFQRGEIEQSIALLREAQHVDAGARNDLIEALIGTLDRYATALLESGEWEKAIEVLSELIKMAPDIIEYYLDLARAWLQSGELTEALAIVRQALERFPADREINELLRSMLRG